MVDEGHIPAYEGDVLYTGFEGDLLRHLVDFAREDEYDLSFNLTLRTQNYGAALDVLSMIATLQKTCCHRRNAALVIL